LFILRMARKEKDSLGEVEVPENVYYGSFTQRAKDNFKLSGIKEHPALIKAYILVKKAAANANIKLKSLDSERGNAIIEACDEILDGNYQDQFVLDMFQAGAGTPFNMNSNEVIANLASEKLGKEKGSYYVHPNDHVNMGQSSNNVTPTAVKVASLLLLKDLISELELLSKEFRKKGKEYGDLVKVGRTHLMDAVPITYGQVFNSYASSINHSAKRLERNSGGLLEIGLGGNAIGTGINTDDKFREIAASELSKITDFEFKEASDNIEMTWTMAPFVEFSSSIKNLALELDKISSDLRLLSSGPKAGLNEITLPEVEPGSSIMPGKINPSIAEAVNQVCLQVVGNCSVIDEASRSGQLELNFYTPLIGFNLIWSLELLTRTVKMFNEKCIAGLEVNEERVKELFDKSVCQATALCPELGYSKVAELVKEAWKKDKSMKELVLEKDLLEEEKVEELFKAENLT
ncbi:MAG: aspartate ammonia-lyase, partial [Candidatus Undinarchaeales archaeon]